MSIFTDFVSLLAILFSLVFLIVVFVLLLGYFLNCRKQSSDHNDEESGAVLCNLGTRNFSMFIRSNEKRNEQSIQDEPLNESSNNLKNKIFIKDRSKQTFELEPMVTTKNDLDKNYFTDLIRYRKFFFFILILSLFFS